MRIVQCVVAADNRCLRRPVRCRAAACLLAVLVLLPGAALTSRAELPQVTVVHVNDTHGYIDASTVPGTGVHTGGIARLATLVDRERANAAAVLVLHAGDAFTGAPCFTVFAGEAQARLLNAVGLDAMCLGNHEFDRGVATLARFADLLQAPLLSCNLDLGSAPELAGRVLPCVVVRKGGVPIGVIGVTTPLTSKISREGRSLRFTDPAIAVQQAVDDLRRHAVACVIVLSHLGLEQDMALAAQVAGIDLIVGGHSHTLLGATGVAAVAGDRPYPVRVTGPHGRLVPIVQAWQRCWAAGVARLQIAADGRAIFAGGRPHLLLAAAVPGGGADARIAPQPDVAAVVSGYRHEVDRRMGIGIARAAQDLPHAWRQGQGSRAAPLVARAVLWYLRSLGLAPDLALLNAGNVRTGLSAGTITLGQVFAMLPFENTVVVTDMRGQDIRRELRTALDRAGRSTGMAGARPYVAGLCRRAGSWRLTTARGELVPLLDNATYRVAMTSYLAGGGDGYVGCAAAARQGDDTGFTLTDAFIAYARAHTPLRAVADACVDP